MPSTALPVEGSRAGAEPALVNRKLIRPRLEQHVARAVRRPMARRRPQPPDQTGLEATFYVRQGAAHGSVVVTLEDGTVVQGVIEWTDRDCIALRRSDMPAIVVMKQAIVHVAPDEGAGRRG